MRCSPATCAKIVAIACHQRKTMFQRRRRGVRVRKSQAALLAQFDRLFLLPRALYGLRVPAIREPAAPRWRRRVGWSADGRAKDGGAPSYPLRLREHRPHRLFLQVRRVAGFVQDAFHHHFDLGSGAFAEGPIVPLGSLRSARRGLRRWPRRSRPGRRGAWCGVPRRCRRCI